MGFARMQGEFHSRVKSGVMFSDMKLPTFKAIGSAPGRTRTSTNNVLEAPERQTKGVPCHY